MSVAGRVRRIARVSGLITLVTVQAFGASHTVVEVWRSYLLVPDLHGLPQALPDLLPIAFCVAFAAVSIEAAYRTIATAMKLVEKKESKE